jgi:hypothetical protein
MHIENSPRIGPELANRNGTGRIVETTIAPWEGRFDIGESTIGAERVTVVTKAVYGLCTCACGVLPFGLGR